MNLIIHYGNMAQNLLDKVRIADFLGPLALRLYLVPVFWMAGMKKLADPEGTIQWFAHALNLPFPVLMFWMASLTEAVGAILLLLGLCTRWIAVPLMATMLVAIVTVHWEFGWLAIASSKAPDIAPRLGKAIELLREYGNYEWLTEKGRFVVLNNGIQFAVTYFLMLLALFFTGGGRYISADYWIARAFRR